MTTIPDGYRAAIIDPSGTVIDTVDLGGYDLSKSLGAAAIADEIAATIPTHPVGSAGSEGSP